MAEGNRADTALDGLRRVEAKAVCALTPHPPHSKTLARGPALSLVQGRKARQNLGEFSPGLRPPSPRGAGRGQGEGLVVGGSWPVSTASAPRELSNTHGNSVFCEARPKIENILKRTHAGLRQGVAARANPGRRQHPPKIVGGNGSGIPLLYMKRVYEEIRITTYMNMITLKTEVLVGGVISSHTPYEAGLGPQRTLLGRRRRHEADSFPSGGPLGDRQGR